MLKEYAKRFELKVFIETGTYRGDTVKAMLLSGLFDRIHTVDIYEDRVLHSQSRFKSFPHVECHWGDSAEVLPVILSKTDKPALFWLDAHHSGKQIARKQGLIETPILAELTAALSYSDIYNSVILIDDARYYIEFPKKYPYYPKTEILQEMVKTAIPDWIFETEQDIIRCHRRLD